jgi:PucR family transcriptional regulator, proline-responsive transcriptional activator
MPVSDVQQLLDTIASESGTGASVDDLAGQLVAYSTHRGRADDARVRALLERRSPEDVRAWETSHGTATAVHPLVIPANDELGMSARICIPLVHRGIRAGLLFLISDEASPTGDQATATADRLAGRTEALAALIYESSTPRLDDRRVREGALLDACRGDGLAARRLAESTGPATTGQGFLVTVTLLRGDGSTSERDAEHDLAQTRVAAHQVLSPRTLVHAVTHRQVVSVLRARPSEPSADAATDAATDVHDRLAHVLPAAGPTGVALARDLATETDVAHARALTAAQAAAVDPALADVTAWSDIGVYRLLTRLADAAPRSELLDRLAQAPNGEVLLSTLESVYDHPGGVQAAAGALHLHRTSLYYRLGRIRDLLGADPLNGQTRTELHLALKLRRWERRPLV